MDMQGTELRHETAYILDGLTEDCDVDSASTMMLRYFGDRAVIERIVAREEPVTQWYAWRKGLVDEITAYADELLAQLTMQQRGAMLAIGLAHARLAIGRSAKYMSEAAITDRVEGGMCESYNRPPVAYKNDEVTPLPKVMRRLNSPAWIRRYVKRDDETFRLRNLCAPLIRRAAAIPPELVRDGMELFRADIDDVKRRHSAYVQAQAEAIRLTMAGGATFEEALDQTRDLVVKLKPGVRQKMRLERINARKVARRAASTATSIVGPEAVSQFVAGKETIVTGPNLAFGVKRLGYAQQGHGAISLRVLTPAHEPLAELCFYIEKTPAIDQLTAVALHAFAGEERDIIEAGNIIDVTPLGASHPALTEKAVAHRAARAENWIPMDTPEARERVDQLARVIRRDLTALRNERNASYWAATQAVWLEAVGVQALGHGTHKLMIRSTDPISDREAA